MTEKKKPANTQITGKRGGKTKTSWKEGESGNPKGAPKRGESWTEIIKFYGDMTPQEAAEHATKIAGKLRTMGDHLTLKQAVVLKVYVSLADEPTASLLNSFMDRAEGKVREQVDVTSNGQSISDDNERARRIAEILDTLRARRDRQAPDDGTPALPTGTEATS